jgi:hypothetical protein
MQGNGRRPRPGKTSPKEPEQPQSDPKEEQASPPDRATPVEQDEDFRQNDRVLRIVRQNADQKFGTDILAAGIIIFVLVACSLVAYFIWAYALSRPAHNANPPPGIVLPL